MRSSRSFLPFDVSLSRSRLHPPPPTLSLSRSSPVNLDLPRGQAGAGRMGLLAQLPLPPFCLSRHKQLDVKPDETHRNCFFSSFFFSPPRLVHTARRAAAVTRRASSSLFTAASAVKELDCIEGESPRSGAVTSSGITISSGSCWLGSVSSFVYFGGNCYLCIAHLTILTSG